MKKTSVDKMLIDAEIKFIKKNRVNFSLQADEIVAKAQKGDKLTSTDYFILLNTNQEQIDKLIKFDDVTNRMNKGRITHEDIDFLISELGKVGELEPALRKAMYQSADRSNYNYAKEHQEEFSIEELTKMEEVCSKIRIKKTIQEEINDVLSC